MPRFSDRNKALRAVRQRVELAIMLQSSSSDEEGLESLEFELLGFNFFDKTEWSTNSDSNLPLDSSSNSENQYSDSDDCPETLHELYFIMYNTRYLAPRKIQNKSMEFRQHFFHVLSDSLFRQVTRMSKSLFFSLLEQVESHPIFQNQANPQQAPIETQLAVCLDGLGHDGNGACIAHMIPTWGISIGSIVNFSKRCFHALEEVFKTAIESPGPAEREIVSAEFAKRGFPGCVGLIDGSLMPFSQRPHISGECYCTRKSRYAINVQVVCDHHRRITHLFAGMPGSCSDLTCTKKSPIWAFVSDVRANALFDDGQYILADSGYQCMPHMVCAFKRTDTHEDKLHFNTCVAKCRVTNEHCIGVLKARWHSLKEIRVELKSKVDSVWMVRWIALCGKLHNYVMDKQDEWADEDIAANAQGQASVEPDEEMPPSGHPEPGRVSQRRLVATGLNLLDQVMDIALEHHRRLGGFLSHDV